MKTRTTFATATVLLGGLILLGAFDWEPARGQNHPPGGLGSSGGTGMTGFFYPRATPSQIRNRKLRDALKSLRTAKTVEAKTKAKEAVTKLLKEQFDADLKQREKEIANIEARIRQLRSVLEKRRTARDEIIQLQLKVIVNEAEGLGFPKQSTGTGGGSVNRLELLGIPGTGSGGSFSPRTSR